MKSITSGKLNKLGRSAMILLLAVVFSMAFLLTASPASAYELDGKYSSDSGVSTTIYLYKVGHFESGAIVLDEAYANLPVNIPNDIDQDDPDWAKAWMDSAYTLSNYVKESTLVATGTTDASGAFSFSGLDNGLYLLVGDSQKIENYPTQGRNSYWWPMPMYVKILNGDATILIKPQTAEVKKIRVVKIWQNDEDVADQVRPASIEVKIYYGSTEEADLRETITLSADNDWSYEWDVDKDEDPSKWYCEEVLSEQDQKNYSISQDCKDGADDVRIIQLINTYQGSVPPDNPPRTKTGDSFNLIFGLLIMALALIIGIVAFVRMRKK